MSSLAVHMCSRDSAHPVTNGNRKRARTLSPHSPEHEREKRPRPIAPRHSSHSPQTPLSLSRQNKLPDAYRPATISSPIRVSSDSASESESLTDSPPAGRVQNGLPHAYASRSSSHQPERHHHQRHHEHKHHRKHRSEKRRHRDSSSSRERDRRRHHRHRHRREQGEEDRFYQLDVHRSNSAPGRHRQKERARLRKAESYMYR